MKEAEKALTPPKGIEASEEKTSSGGIIRSFKKHPFLRGDLGQVRSRWWCSCCCI